MIKIGYLWIVAQIKFVVLVLFYDPFYIQSTFDISKSKFNPNYRYIKVNFLVPPENLLLDINRLS